MSAKEMPTIDAFFDSVKNNMKTDWKRDFSLRLPQTATHNPNQFNEEHRSKYGIRKCFKPIAIFSKSFGMFPLYDLDFVGRLEVSRTKVIHALDYIYSIFLLGLITSGAIICAIHPPSVLVRMQSQKDTQKDLLMDYYVNMGLVYVTMANGVLSLLLFPSMSGRSILKLLSHFEALDKILQFSDNKLEWRFGLKVLFHKVVIFLGSFASFVGLYIVEVREEENEVVCTTDYVIPFVLAVSGTCLIIPTGLVIFFLNALRLRLFHFNQVIEGLLKPFTPTCDTCLTYKDYGSDLINTAVKDDEELAVHLEKMRMLHAEMRSLACELGCIFGGHLVRDFLFSIMGLILYTYLLIYMGDSYVTNWFIYLVLDSFLLVKILVMTSFAQRIICYGKASKTMLRKVSLLRLGHSCQLQMQMFIDTVSSPIEMNAAGYFTIDRNLLTSIIGAITTYFIILIQFKVGNVKQELQVLTSMFRNYTHLYDFIVALDNEGDMEALPVNITYVAAR